MKKIIIVLIACFSFPMTCFSSTPQEIVEQVWQGRREIGTEQTLWRVQDYVQLKGCADVADLSCYKAKGAEKHLAQSVMFDESGKDGIWFTFFAPKKVKGKGASVRISPNHLTDSPRFFCRGGRLSRGGARRITASIEEQKSIDAVAGFSWAMMLMQSGSEIFANDLFVYSFADTNIVKAQAKGKLPSHTIYINEQNAIKRMEFFDGNGKLLWIIKNMQIAYNGDKWQPTTIFVVNVAKKTVILLKKDDSLSFNKWAKSYGKKSLSCGR